MEIERKRREKTKENEMREEGEEERRSRTGEDRRRQEGREEERSLVIYKYIYVYRYMSNLIEIRCFYSSTS
tara:strand:+ start:449 stop:661 length:213 start_codon:yes stop_codon:yes gene_type:complete